MDRTEQAICQKLAWLDQQGFSRSAVDKIVDQMRSLFKLGPDQTAHLLMALSLTLQIRSQNKAAEQVFAAYKLVDAYSLYMGFGSCKEKDDDSSGSDEIGVG